MACGGLGTGRGPILAAPSLGANWYFWGTVTSSSPTLAVSGPAGEGQVCLLQQVSTAAYDADGEATATTDALGRTTVAVYDALGDQTATDGGQVVYSVANAPGFKASTSQWAFSNLSASQLGGFDVYVYSATGENEGVFNATGASLNTSATPGTASPGPGWCFIGTASLNSGSFAFAIGETSGLLPGEVCVLQERSAAAYDLDGEIKSETDADDNVTQYGYDGFGRLDSQQTSIQCTAGQGAVSASTAYAYDANGNLVDKTDPDGNLTAFAYDDLNRETGETWYGNTNGTTNSTSYASIAYGYDADGETLTATEYAGSVSAAAYKFTYDSAGDAMSVENDIAGGATTPSVPDVLLTSTYDADGDRASLSATVGGTADFANKLLLRQRQPRDASHPGRAEHAARPRLRGTEAGQLRLLRRRPILHDRPSGRREGRYSQRVHL